MEKKIARRLLCLILALQLGCAPLVSAHAVAEPAPIAPAETAPVQTAPAPTVPAETAPAQTVPAPTAPVQTAPVQEPTPLPAESTPPIEAEPEQKPALPGEETANLLGGMVPFNAAPYAAVFHNSGYAPYAQTGGREGLKYNVEGTRSLPSVSTWSAGETSFTLTTLRVRGKDPFPLIPAGRVPDRAFGGWAVYEGAQTNQANFLDDPAYHQRIAASTGMGGYTNIPAFFSAQSWLPLIGQWVRSGDADLRAQTATATQTYQTGLYPVTTGGASGGSPLQLYSADLSGKTPQELNAITTDFQSEKAEYWLRVPAEVEALDLSLITAEPFAFEGDEDPLGGMLKHVSVAASFGGEVTAVPPLTPERLNYFTGTSTATNDAAHPASARFTILGGDATGARSIKLKPSAGEGKLYNDISVNVIPPDNGPAKTYTFHVQRLADPKLLPQPGNSPMGMLCRDSFAVAVAGRKLPFETVRKDAVDYFKQNLAFSANGLVCYPTDDVNNSGSLKWKPYRAAAWAGQAENPDLDPNTIVAYQNSSFTEPGLALTDGEGKPVTLANAGNGLDRRVLLRVVAKLDSSSLRDGFGDWTHLGTDGGLQPTADVNTAFLPVQSADGQTVFDLRSAKIRPGIYQMEYRFTDKVSGKAFDGDKNKGSFYAPALAHAYTRALIVLPVPGDVDMDGTVTVADAVALARAIADPSSFLSKTDDKTAMLFKYRVCDLDGSGDVDGADATLLRAVSQPQMKGLNGQNQYTDYYYLPLPGLPRAPRQTLPSPSETPGKVGVSLEYIGKNSELIRNTNDTAAIEAEVTQNAAQPLMLGDIFWVGVRLTGMENAVGTDLVKALDGFTVTLGYDGSLVAAVTNSGDLDGTAGRDDWAAMMTRYNIGTADNPPADGLLWGGPYVLTAGSAAAKGDPLVAEAQGEQFDRSKGISAVEKAAGKAYRELQFSIYHPTESARRTLPVSGNSYVLRVPLRLVRHPHNAESVSALDLSLGMRQLNFVAQDGSGSAWSMGEIYGGATKNLTEKMEYRGGSACARPLGTDKTVYQKLQNEINSLKTVYGESFLCSNLNLADLSAGEQLPPGLTYRAQTGVLSGMPTQAGVFRFYLGTVPYELTVEKAPLTLTVNPQARYYGEENPTFTFDYDPAQIKAPDLLHGANHVSGFDPAETKGTMLKKLKGWAGTGCQFPEVLPLADMPGGAPGVTPVAPATPVGRYHIVIRGGTHQNYQISYRRTADEVLHADWGNGVLHISPRPVYVEKIAQKVGPLLNSGSQSKLQNLPAELSGSKTEFTLLPGTAVAAQEGLNLTGAARFGTDALKITYDAQYLFALGDKPPYFTLKSSVEQRQVQAQNPALTIDANTQNGNYRLVAPFIQDTDLVGTVTNLPVSKLELKNPHMEYTTGDKLKLDDMAVTITYRQGSTEKTELVPYKQAETFAGYGLNICYVDKPGDVPVPGQNKLAAGDEMKAAVHNGKYLCIWVQNPGDGNTPGSVIACYSGTSGMEPPKGAGFTVHKGLVKLKPEAKARYYGEENPPLTFIYDVNQLSPEDRAGRSGQGADLKGLAGYVPPTLRTAVSVENQTELTPRTEVSKDYLVLISGASSANYDFSYYRMETENLDRDLGYNALEIVPRPIVVNTLTMGSTSDYFLYDDTASTSLVKMYYKAGGVTTERLPTAYSDAVDKDCFTAVLPAAGGYHPAGGSNEPVSLKHNLSGEAILAGDKVALNYRGNYEAESKVAPYFTLTAGHASELRKVHVRALALTPTTVENKNKNYLLVYQTNQDGIDRRPADETAVTQGIVKMRPIASLAVTQPPTYRSYTYGDVLALGGMALKITYETAGDNVKNNSPVRSLAYSEDRDGSGKVTDTSFWKLGLRLYWTQDGGTLGAEAKPGDYMDVAQNNAKRLLVSGRRDATHAQVAAAMAETDRYQVVKKTLPLLVQPQYRYYGEANSRYTFTFDPKNLAQQDRSKVTGLICSGGADAAGTPTESAALLALGGYAGPLFTSAASQSSAAAAEPYALSLSGGSLDNYSFAYQDAGIRVFRRPIVVTEITKKPVTTIFRDTPETDFRMTASSALGGFTAALPVAAGGICHDRADADYVSAVDKQGMPGDLTLSGAPIYGGDLLELSGGVRFKPVAERAPMGGAASVEDAVKVTDIALANSAAIQNYILVGPVDASQNALAATKPQAVTATAHLDMRNIATIAVVDSPNLSYTYGETLDLSALTVLLTYQALQNPGGGETTPEPETIHLGDRGGIYVNYWDEATVGALTKEQRAAVVAEHRPASSGDHLTIAPVHDAGKYKAEQSGNNFAHNGRHLIVSAIQHGAYGFVQPVLVPTALTVAPLDLHYSFAAQGKVYDGDSEAAGTLTLTNPYDRDGVTDYVYAVTKTPAAAAYETPDAYHENPRKTAFEHYVQTNRYAFPVGEHSGTDRLKFTFLDRNVKYADDLHSTEHPVSADKPYWDAPDRTQRHDAYGPVASQPVLVSQMLLGGPDRANYTLDAAVGRQENVGSGEKATVPFAVIDKKERPAPTAVPGVGVDRHTNAAKLTFGQALTTADDPMDDFNKETHFEYALVYRKKSGSDGAIIYTPTNWAGDDGLAPRGYQDGIFFGGETVTCLWPEGYVPEREEEHKPLKEDDTIEGQLYRWAGEDGGFVPVTGNGTWQGYTMYKTTRLPLPRDEAFWAQVRVSETHNYKPSLPITSSEEASREQDLAAAKALAQQETDRLADERYRPAKGEDTDPPPLPKPAAKTYLQRLDLVSTEEAKGANDIRFPLETLQSVWFTDLLEYEKQTMLDNVLRNSDPVRYYGYHWDVDKSAALDFKQPIDLTASFPVEIKKKAQDGSTTEETITVNEKNTARVFATITNPNNSVVLVKKVTIDTGDVEVPLGTAPLQLTVSLTPQKGVVKTLLWKSSEERVAAVNAKGLLTFTGIGTAVITVTAFGGKTDKITVRVCDPKEFIDPKTSVFDRRSPAAFFTLDEQMRFYPERPMTRGELVVLLAQFYKSTPAWKGSGDGDFADISGTEPYAEAAALLGRLGVLLGVENGKFAGEQIATRAELAALLARMLGIADLPLRSAEFPFRDSTPQETWAAREIALLAERGLLEGVGDGYFNPNGMATRAQVACLLGRVLERSALPPQSAQKPTDVAEESWAYPSVLHAINGSLEKPDEETAKTKK